MARIKPAPPPSQRTSLFASPESSESSTSPVLAASSQTKYAALIQSTQRQGDKATAEATVAEKAQSASSKRRRPWDNGGGSISRRTVSILFLVLLDLLGVVPIIILITTTATPTNVSAVSIAAVTVSSSAYGDSKGNVVSGNFDNKQHYHHQQPGRSPQLSLVTGNDAKGNGSTVGKLNLSFGEITFSNRLQLDKKEMSEKAIKNERSLVNRRKRGIGETRIIVSHDVSTMALALENSSSVAIANINSGNNILHVVIQNGSNSNSKQTTTETHNFDPFLERDKHHHLKVV